MTASIASPLRARLSASSRMRPVRSEPSITVSILTGRGAVSGGRRMEWSSGVGTEDIGLAWEELKGGDGDKRRQRRGSRQAGGTDGAVLEAVLQDGEAGGVGRVGDDSEAAAGDSAGDHGIP